MTRQETVIKICRITRIIGDIKFHIDTEGKVDFSMYLPDLMEIDKWMKEICEYVRKDICPQLTKLIDNLGYNNFVEPYVKSHKREIDPEYLRVLASYFERTRRLFAIKERNSVIRRGEYADLVEPLANEQVADLLDRAVKAGLLNEHYQPVAGIQATHLKVIAYAVSTICGFRELYQPFVNQWNSSGIKSFRSNFMPKHSDEYLSTMALYPEVDFSRLTNKQYDDTPFYVTQSNSKIRDLYNELKEYGYIASDTRVATFMGIVGRSKSTAPVDWVQEQRKLGIFVHMAFGKYNTRDLLSKTARFFTVNGNVPHTLSLSSGHTALKRAGRLDDYDTQLCAICAKFCKE